MTEVTDDDMTLLSRIVARDREAFALFYRQYERPLYWYLFSYVQEQAVAEELVIDVMFDVWHSAAQRFRGEAKVKTWLLRIAWNKARNYIARHRLTNSV
jgi:RNA polymerase sigma-70 factor (ECF subfamily)